MTARSTSKPGRMPAWEAKRVQYTMGLRPGIQAKRHLAVGAALFLIPVVLYLLSLFVTPFGLGAMDAHTRFQPPDLTHWFGTDNYGRDIFVRAMAGFPVTLLIAGCTVLIGCFGGLILGALAGYLGRSADYIISRFNDALLSIPTILMGMLFVAVFGSGVWMITLALGLMFIPSYARVVRSGFMELRSRDFVKRLRLLGASPARIIFRHLLPQIRSRLLSAAAIGFANAILAESSLSFLGLGVPPSSVSWGRMMKDAQGFMFNAPWYAVCPGVLLVLLVLGAFFIGQGLKQLGETGGCR